MADIGSQLREARESLQLSLLEVERETRIRRLYLQALEEDRFSDLPDDVYTRGFLRNYALFLNLNPQPFLDEYDALRIEPVQYVPQVLDEPLLPALSNNIGGRVFLIIMAFIVIVLLGWFVFSRIYGNAGLENLLRSLAAKTPTIVKSVPTITPVVDTETIPAAQAAEPTLLPTVTSSPNPTPTSTAIPLPTSTITNVSGILVQAAILSDTWVVITVDGEQTFQGTLAAGERFSWTAQSTLDLHLGNAGGISVTVNGVTVGLLGETGEVKDIIYTLDTLPQSTP
ncbi:MAG: helix-turn-helix domain-containing protein [Anaerolineae bacterium]